MTFLPDGRMLVTEKAGTLLLVSADGKTGIPAVDSARQSALKDVVLHPHFEHNQQVYFSYSEAGQGGKGVHMRSQPINAAWLGGAATPLPAASRT